MRVIRALLGLTLIASITASCTTQKKEIVQNGGLPQPGTLPVNPTTPGVTPGVEPGEQQNGNAEPGTTGASVGMSDADFQKGKVFVNGWDGLQDQFIADSHWAVANIAAPGATQPPSGGVSPGLPPSGGVSPANPANPANPVNPGNPGNPPAGPANPPANPDEVVFHIKKGTGSGAWNTAETEAVLKVGKKFTIVNDDDVTHQWHTNGSPCPHGNPIRPGKSETCTPSRAFTDGPLYDHISEGKFYIRAE